MMNKNRVPVIFDTDIGDDIDDLYALYLALFLPELDLRAVTTAYGDTQARARLAAKALRLAGREDISVGAGISMSQARVALGQTQPALTPREKSYTRFVNESDDEACKVYPSAHSIILETLQQSDEPIAIVTEGAMSNAAEALIDLGANAARYVRCIASMGGETKAMLGEHNIRCDPESAEIVLNSGLPVFLGTFQVSSQLRLTLDEVKSNFGDSSSSVHQALFECTELWAETHGRSFGPVLYDALPVLWLADNDCVETRQSEVHVELCGKHTRGLTVRTGEGQVLESTGIDVPALMGSIIRTLKSAPQ